MGLAPGGLEQDGVGRVQFICSRKDSFPSLIPIMMEKGNIYENSPSKWSLHTLQDSRISGVTGSQNHTKYLGLHGTCGGHLVQPAHPNSPSEQAAQEQVRRLQKISKVGGSTASVGNLLQCT